MEFGFRADFQLRWLWDQQQAKPQDLRSLGLPPIPGPRCVLGDAWEVWGEGDCCTCREPILRCFLRLVLQVHAHTLPCSRITRRQARCFLLQGSRYGNSCRGGFAPGPGTARLPLCLQQGGSWRDSSWAAGSPGTAQGRPLTSEREHSLGHLAGLAGNCPGRWMGTAADTGRRGGPR